MEYKELLGMLGDKDFPERIKLLAELAHKADPGHRVFGSEKHKYSFAPTAEKSAVSAVEQEYGFTFPEDYVRYLTEVGNGGAAVDYGIFSLEDALQNNSYLNSISAPGLTLFDFDDPGAIYDAKTTEITALDEAYAGQAEEQIERLTADITRGMFIIGTAGCTYDYFIMCSGSKRGQVGKIDWNLMEGRKYAPFLYGKTFSEWIEDHFMRVILGKVISRGSFDTVDTAADITGELTPPRKKPEPSAAENKAQSKPLQTSQPARESSAPASAPRPAPQPAPQSPQPAPAPQPQRPQPVTLRSGDFIRHTDYGDGIITNIVGNIITVELVSGGTRSFILPFDKDKLNKL